MNNHNDDWIELEKMEMEGLVKVLKYYFDDLDYLQLRLQKDYNDDEPFVQDEQDRLALGMVLDVLQNVFKKGETKWIK